MRIVIIPFRQPHLVKRPLSNLDSLRFGHLPGNHQSLCHIFQSRLIAEQIVILEYKCGLSPYFCNIPLMYRAQVYVLLVKNHRPFIRLFKKIDTTQKGGLSRTAGTEDCHHVPFLHLDVHTLQDFLSVKGFPYVFYLQHFLPPIFIPALVLPPKPSAASSEPYRKQGKPDQPHSTVQRVHTFWPQSSAPT